MSSRLTPEQFFSMVEGSPIREIVDCQQKLREVKANPLQWEGEEEELKERIEKSRRELMHLYTRRFNPRPVPKKSLFNRIVCIFNW